MYWEGPCKGPDRPPWHGHQNPNFEMVRPAHHPELSRRAISNDQNLNDRNGTEEIFIVGAKAAVLNIRKFEFRICFGFRASNFEIMVDCEAR